MSIRFQTAQVVYLHNMSLHDTLLIFHGWTGPWQKLQSVLKELHALDAFVSMSRASAVNKSRLCLTWSGRRSAGTAPRPIPARIHTRRWQCYTGRSSTAYRTPSPPWPRADVPVRWGLWWREYIAERCREGLREPGRVIDTSPGQGPSEPPRPFPQKRLTDGDESAASASGWWETKDSSIVDAVGGPWFLWRRIFFIYFFLFTSYRCLSLQCRDAYWHPEMTTCGSAHWLIRSAEFNKVIMTISSEKII